MTIIDFIHGTRLADLPSDTIDAAIRALVDTLGVAVAGRTTGLSHIIHEHAARQFGGTGATLWQDGRVVSAAGAALANGMTIDAVDAHDGHKLTKGHVGCGTIPALIALMEAEGLTDPQEMLTSLVIGYEIGTRAGIALHASASDYHTSGAWIALAVAALGARVLRLDAAATREAVGIAEYHGPRSQMMRCIDAPTMVKDGSGWGAMAGVCAAYLARDGFTGAPAITVDGTDVAAHWADLGQVWHIRDQYTKIYPVCRWAQPAVEALLAVMRDNRIDASTVKGVRIETFHEACRLRAIPTTTEQAQYSLPFSVAVALIHGTVGVEHISGSGLQDPDIRDRAQAIEMREDTAFNAAFPARRLARARLRLTDGRELSSAATEAQGDPENPLPDDEIWTKFRRLAGPVINTERADALLDTARSLPQTASTESLFTQLAAAR
ncbi:MAG: MmgE/PrpD family protein [Pseudomonadota bacterium]